MPDRSLRLLTAPPRRAPGGEHFGVLLRERPASPPEASSGRPDRPEEDNPFAPPPEGAPDQPWQPRHPSGGPGSDGQGSDGSGSGSDGGGRSPWGSQWSDRQPSRSPGGWGERPGGPEGPGPGRPMRWDPTDPVQRRARYSLLGGMWAFFFALFGWPYVALLLGALGVYWAVSSLRAKPRTPDPDNPAPAPQGRPQRTAALSGLVTSSLALALVMGSFTVQLVYRDYYTCTQDALTNVAKKSCEKLLPEELREVFGDR